MQPGGEAAHMSDTVMVSHEGTIATVVLNNPERLNALNRPMWERLGAVTAELSADDSLRCVVIRGAGTKAFAAGADIAEFERERGNVEQAAIRTEATGGVCWPIARLSVSTSPKWIGSMPTC